MDIQAALATLQRRIADIPEKDRAFAKDLLAANSRGQLTPGRAKWVAILAERLDKPAPIKTEIGDLSGALALFDKAAASLKHPAIVLAGPDGTELRLTIASERARVPGSITVAEDAPYGMARWFGRILRDGTFQASQEETPDWLVPLLTRFALQPASVAAEHGRLHGRCCFCNLKLGGKGRNAARSTAAGFGETCAKKWGLHPEWRAASDVLLATANDARRAA